LVQCGIVKRWFFTPTAITMLVLAAVGFLPAILNTAARRAPLSLLAALHGIVYFAWPLIFLLQARLATRIASQPPNRNPLTHWMRQPSSRIADKPDVIPWDQFRVGNDSGPIHSLMG
jgi:hypothetical protein